MFGIKLLDKMPYGVNIRRLDDSRRAVHQSISYKFSASFNGKFVVYGNTQRGVLNKLSKAMEESSWQELEKVASKQQPL